MGSKKIAESNLWGWLSSARFEFKKDLQMVRIENSVESGTPDVYGQLNREGSFWIELKAWDLPRYPNAPFKHAVTPEQISWINSHTQAGGNAGVLIQFGSARDAHILLVPGFRILLLQQQYLSLSDFRAMSWDVTKYKPTEIIQKVLHG